MKSLESIGMETQRSRFSKMYLKTSKFDNEVDENS